MKLVFYSVVLNHHQAQVADEFFNLLGNDFYFVELINLGDNKGSMDDYSKRPYLLRAWESQEKRAFARDLACTADCCVFSGVKSLPYQKERLKLGLLSFDMGERWLKRGFRNLLSPRLIRWLVAYWLGNWRNKPLYKLCCSSFCAADHYMLHTFENKCYKWGYFTKLDNKINLSSGNCLSDVPKLMWCSRFLVLKHPELPILLAEKLKRNGYHFKIDMYGSGGEEIKAKQLVHDLCLTDMITFHGAISNDQVHAAMREHDIFLFTSDRYEGWGAVSNESLSEGCVLVASDAVGSTKYLIKEGINGFSFKSPKTSSGFCNPDYIAVDSLYESVSWLLDHPIEQMKMKAEALDYMHKWSPKNAAESLMLLISRLKQGDDTLFTDGPCSKA